jgi:hypothetical protein
MRLSLQPNLAAPLLGSNFNERRCSNISPSPDFSCGRDYGSFTV